MKQGSIAPKNLAGTAYFNIKSVTVAEFHELPNGEGPPTEVHLAIDVDGESLRETAAWRAWVMEHTEQKVDPESGAIQRGET